MTYVQSFSRVTPPPRYDDIAWTDLEIWEAATKTGTFALIDTQAIAEDLTPETPDTIAVTTVLAELPVGWYEFRFTDSEHYSNFTRAVLAPAGSTLEPGDDTDGPSQALERITTARRGRITVQFLDDDELPVEPDDTPIVTVIDADEVLLLQDEPATVDPEDDTRFTVIVPAAALPEPTTLTAVWTATVDDVEQRVVTTIEVCASHLFGLAQLRELLDEVRTLEQQSTREFTVHELRRARLNAERDLEDACHQAFTTRYEREVVRVDQYARARARWPHVTRMRSVTIDDGDPLTTEQLADVTLGPGTTVAYATPWVADAVLTFAYEHGRPVAGTEQAALILAKERLLRGPISDRATQQAVQGELGGTIRLLTPGQRGVITGIPVVDEFIGRNTWTSVRLA